MKRIYTYLIVVMAVIGLMACNNEWQDEQYEHYVSFKAPNVPQSIYVRYNKGGKVTYKLPIIISGSTKHEKDIDVHVTLDPDTLAAFNEIQFGTRTDIFYRELPSKFYQFNEVTRVPAKQDVELLDLNFDLNGIDMVEKWVLPLQVAKGADYGYTPHPRQYYSKALLRVIPFNDFSGNYSTTTMEVYSLDDNGNNIGGAMVTNNRTGHVVNDSTIFFYAGLVDQDLRQRAMYKIFAQFNADKTMTFWADNPDINFKMEKVPSYSVTNNMDAVRPYLLHRYVTFTVEYTFDDLHSATVPLHYKVKGSLALERNLNTQIPDEDQAIEW